MLIEILVMSIHRQENSTKNESQNGSIIDFALTYRWVRITEPRKKSKELLFNFGKMKMKHARKHEKNEKRQPTRNEPAHDHTEHFRCFTFMWKTRPRSCTSKFPQTPKKNNRKRNLTDTWPIGYDDRWQRRWPRVFSSMYSQRNCFGCIRCSIEIFDGRACWESRTLFQRTQKESRYEWWRLKDVGAGCCVFVTLTKGGHLPTSED